MTRIVGALFPVRAEGPNVDVQPLVWNDEWRVTLDGVACLGRPIFFELRP